MYTTLPPTGLGHVKSPTLYIINEYTTGFHLSTVQVTQKEEKKRKKLAWTGSFLLSPLSNHSFRWAHNWNKSGEYFSYKRKENKILILLFFISFLQVCRVFKFQTLFGKRAVQARDRRIYRKCRWFAQRSLVRIQLEPLLYLQSVWAIKKQKVKFFHVLINSTLS